MENGLIYSSAKVYEGGVSIGSYSSEELISKNTSISYGKREANAFKKKDPMDTTEGQSFSLCEWVECTAPQGGALYDHDNENAILAVENCSFVRCNASSARCEGICALKTAECVDINYVYV
ncbi:uncharacterized protein MONOS_13249 [Monocercomonoides exilis]|uniref:uncharacterized protein n=1 Tax=Monocercomonoides exilis TaxID=2049356 RepID=UPI00355AB101|nr:hypothetical protein MONOS_13249 [Monocercomonoides exilis]|eukprot:MONOS_13249.1-p1 / transcript=MONOS_13249.1 / gene=MONOS_13249 / organism=Monocercomonoides_exilis_PA203 / gene_product=unspecified product / transcript_product=unspecified product / location=Mono_scaffold00797:21323-21685(-) / protein_length=121 / sequence_SO=supercontig / SO=protein_coding / is_pseudo=false